MSHLPILQSTIITDMKKQNAYFFMLLFVVAMSSFCQLNAQSAPADLTKFYDYYTSGSGYGVKLNDRFKAEVNKAEDRKSTRMNSSHILKSRMPSSARTK